MSTLPRRQREGLLQGLLELIAALNRAGVITVARTCLTCRFFEPAAPSGSGVHRCRLLEKPLAAEDLRVDCPDHEPHVVET
ncbi:hypothetical protein [Limnochorda pilosa]|uniref:hypothetical protein n=1 Tax=Limnochorda pilosa TaxID=1555112 RepID=UPI0011873AFE|nr:hypothetical protein [Limnochorda pilosa]